MRARVTFRLPMGTRPEFPNGHRMPDYASARALVVEQTRPEGEGWVWRDEAGDDPLCYVRDGRVMVEADEVRS